MTKTQPWAIALILMSTLLNATAQILYKLGADKFAFDIYSLATNYYVVAGLITYAVSAAIMIVALRYGELSLLYPIIATGYIWVTIATVYLLNESFNVYKLIGILMIIAGVSLIGLGSKERKSIPEGAA